MIRLSRDNNGNKILIYKTEFGGCGFSGQTNDNLPETHSMLIGYLRKSTAMIELNAYVINYGTDRQKKLLGWD